MKAVKSLVVAIAAVAALVGAGCGGTEYIVRGSQQYAAGADAVINVDDFEAGRHKVRVTITNLTPPDRLGTGMTTFVLWSIARGQAARNEGALQYDSDSRRGTGVFVTPDSSLAVRVTAERSAQAATPSEVLVIEKQINTND